MGCLSRDGEQFLDFPVEPGSRFAAYEKDSLSRVGADRKDIVDLTVS